MQASGLTSLANVAAPDASASLPRPVGGYHLSSAELVLDDLDQYYRHAPDRTSAQTCRYGIGPCLDSVQQGDVLVGGIPATLAQGCPARLGRLCAWHR